MHNKDSNPGVSDSALILILVIAGYLGQVALAICEALGYCR